MAVSSETPSLPSLDTLYKPGTRKRAISELLVKGETDRNRIADITKTKLKTIRGVVWQLRKLGMIPKAAPKRLQKDARSSKTSTGDASDKGSGIKRRRKADNPGSEEGEGVEGRVAHLENVVEGLKDNVSKVYELMSTPPEWFKKLSADVSEVKVALGKHDSDDGPKTEAVDINEIMNFIPMEEVEMDFSKLGQRIATNPIIALYYGFARKYCDVKGPLETYITNCVRDTMEQRYTYLSFIRLIYEQGDRSGK